MTFAMAEMFHDLYEMPGWFTKTLRLLSCRLMMNIYFWAFIIFPRINISAPFWIQAYTVLLFGIPIALVYLNNLFLIPTFLVRKKHYSYLCLVIAATVFSACLYWLAMYRASHLHPGTPVNTYSLITAGEWREGYHYLNYISQWNACFSYLTILVLVFTMAWYMRDHIRQQRVAAELYRKQLETELQSLKAQINPHFLFNTLNNLYGLALEDGAKAADAILRLSDVLRYSLYEAGAPVVSFEAEQNAMRSYIELELLRMHQPKNMSVTISTDTPGIQVAPLLGLPVLENIFKHGTRMINPEPSLSFSYTIKEGILNIYSRNKFKHQEALEKRAAGSGIGLANLRQRLQILYPGRHIIRTAEEGEYYVVLIKVEMN